MVKPDTNVGILLAALARKRDELHHAREAMDSMKQDIQQYQETIKSSIENYMMSKEEHLIVIEDFPGSTWVCRIDDEGIFTMVKAPFINAGDMKEVPF